MKIYIAGPMRGIAARNFPAFDEAEALWRKHGHHPVSPASVCRALCQLDNPPPDFYDDAWERQSINLDIQIILSCHALALLPNWEQSMGATVELALAQFLKLPIYDACSMVLISPPTRPWLPSLTRQLELGRYAPLSPPPDRKASTLDSLAAKHGVGWGLDRPTEEEQRQSAIAGNSRFPTTPGE